MSSINTFLNGTLALMRGNEETAREHFRQISLNRESVSSVASKLYEAMDDLRAQTADNLLVEVQRRTMSLPVPEGIQSHADYLLGVVEVESIINKLVQELRCNGAGPHPAQTQRLEL